uniref:HTH_Tnp_Tc3_1 domain-containing protein n=1 Tax=Caenorhabditis japonica TaxID=281687 RepID=A0A8R1ISB9_CAEJA
MDEWMDGCSSVELFLPGETGVARDAGTQTNIEPVDVKDVWFHGELSEHNANHLLQCGSQIDVMTKLGLSLHKMESRVERSRNAIQHYLNGYRQYWRDL